MSPFHFTPRDVRAAHDAQRRVSWRPRPGGGRYPLEGLAEALRRHLRGDGALRPEIIAQRDMKVARLYDFLDVRIEEEPVPRIGPGEALVRARACGICSGDVVGSELVWSHVKRTGVARTPLRRGEKLQARIEAQLSAIKRMPQLIRSFFKAPSVAYITDW